MLYSEIEQQFQTPEGLEELLQYCQEKLFNRLDEHAQSFRSGVLSDPTPLLSTLEDLTGIYMELKTFHVISVTEKENRELAWYISRKIEIENKGDKFVSASTDKEASNAVALYRRVRNILEGKLESCEKAISVCQSKLSYLKSEIPLNK